MEVIRAKDKMRQVTDNWRCEGLVVGFVPTMGALHDGHLSLIRRCVAECERCVVSIYVNPTQFGPAEDFKQYPRLFEEDVRRCADAGVHCVFAPTDEQMYPAGFGTYVEPHKELSGCMCGAHRSGHFRGVCTVVAKLFNIIRPHRAYFGQKDFQQFLILKRMVDDLDFGVEMVLCEIVREPQGLALSSRNAYLNEEERKNALCLRKALCAAADAVAAGERDAEKILSAARNILKKYPSVKVQYLELRDASTLKPVVLLDKTAVLGIAVYVGRTRLIDNVLLAPGRGEVGADDV
ncbi:MAG: pantoate--beta-alanine ligase [Planctomycetota bacterium]|nr:MAG: pantoate--beta-alanine ligase [Planctomycetota bacterium]